MANLADELQDAAISRAVVLARYDAGLRKRVADLLKQAEADILAALPEATTQTRKDRLTKQLRDIQATLADYYRQAQELTASEMRDLVGIEAAWQSNSINTAVGFDLMSAMPTEASLAAIASDTLVQGAPSADWWRRQSLEAQFRFAATVRRGMAQSQTVTQIARAVRDDMGIAQRNAAALVKTSTQTVAIAARDATMRANAAVIKGKTSVATLDQRTTFVCAAYDGATFQLQPPHAPIPPTKLPYLAIPRNWNCRSAWVPLVRSWRELGIDVDEIPESTRASMDGQIPSGTTFAEFLDRKGAQWQDEYLGPGRAKLYREGKITLSDLIDGNGNPLPLSALR